MAKEVSDTQHQRAAIIELLSHATRSEAHAQITSTYCKTTLEIDTVALGEKLRSSRGSDSSIDELTSRLNRYFDAQGKKLDATDHGNSVVISSKSGKFMRDLMADVCDKKRDILAAREKSAAAAR